MASRGFAGHPELWRSVRWLAVGRKSLYLPIFANPRILVAAMVLPDLEGLDNDKRG